MIDVTQLLLGIVIVTLTVLITIIGIQVYLILHEFQSTVKKANKILDDTGNVSNLFSGMVTGVKNGGKVLEIIKNNHAPILDAIFGKDEAVRNKIREKTVRRFFRGKKSL